MDIDDAYFPRFARSLGQAVFYSKYRVRPVSTLRNKQNMESGGRILMPSSSVRILSDLGIENPWLFRLENPQNGRITHCGVLEFTAEEGRIYVPAQFLTNLDLQNGQLVELRSVNLPVANFAKFQPQSVDFLETTNPRALLENSLRNYACLTVNDIISITYGHKTYALKIVSLGEAVQAARIIDCDVIVDFEPPVGYIEETTETRQEKMLKESEAKTEQLIIKAAQYMDIYNQQYKGQSARTDGKRKEPKSTETSIIEPRTIGIPDYDFVVGSLRYIRKTVQNKPNEVSEESKAFKGRGERIKKARNR